MEGRDSTRNEARKLVGNESYDTEIPPSAKLGREAGWALRLTQGREKNSVLH